MKLFWSASRPKSRLRSASTWAMRRISLASRWGMGARAPTSESFFTGREHESVELAEEVGFEPTVPETGTPVFETGPFNHSGTPPSLPFTRLQFTKNPALLEEFFEDIAALIGQHTGRDRHAVVEPRIGNKLEKTLACPRLRIGRTVDKPGDPAMDDRACAHCARLESHIEHTPVKPPRPNSSACPGQDEAFGMRSRIMQCFAQVKRLGEDPAGAHDHGTDRHLAHVPRLPRELECASHHRLVVRDVVAFGVRIDQLNLIAARQSRFQVPTWSFHAKRHRSIKLCPRPYREH